MNLAELKATREALRKQLNEYDRITPACQNCLHLGAGLCQQYNAAPPAHWLQGPVECEKWDYDFIPF